MTTAVMPVSKNDIGLLETSINSLYDQVDKIIVVSDGYIGLNMNKIEVLQQERGGIGNARVQGILYSEDEYIISADADTYYPQGYVESAVEALGKNSYAKAKDVFPWQDSTEARLERLLYPYINYEFALALRRSKFLEKNLEKYNYTGRFDIGVALRKWLGEPYTFDSYVITRMPTHFFRNLITGIEVTGAIGSIIAVILLLQQKSTKHNEKKK